MGLDAEGEIVRSEGRKAAAEGPPRFEAEQLPGLTPLAHEALAHEEPSSVSSAKVSREKLRERFGFDDFLEGQEEVLHSVLSGHDTLAVRTTGGGKSALYQYAALEVDGVTIVISPLKSLMKDQIREIKERGFKIRAARLDSTTSDEAEDRIFARLKAGKIDILYTTPESFTSGWFSAKFRAAGARLGLLAVDEAHCVSEWGHDFRPEYQLIGERRRELGSPPLLMVTATASPLVRQDILQLLDAPRAREFVGSVARDELTLEVLRFDAYADREAYLLNRLAELASTGTRAIIYCRRISAVEDLVDRARARGLPVRGYHGQMADEDREENQAAFDRRDFSLLIATNAFGMGVNYPDIREVIHFEIPGTLEAYWQEAGRAGRDGMPAFCRLLVDYDSLRFGHRFLRLESVTPDFVYRVYDSLHSRVKPGSRWVSMMPERPPHLGPDEYRDRNVVKAKEELAISLLLEKRLIRKFGWRAELLGPRLSKDDFPITEKELEARMERKRLRFAAMVYYCTQRAGHAQIVRDHLEGNSVEELAAKDHSVIAMDREHAKTLVTMLSAVDRREYIPTALIRHLRSGTGARETGASAFKDRSASDIGLELLWAESEGLVRQVAVKNGKVVIITEAGLRFLQSRGAVPYEPTTWSELSNRVLHPRERARLATIVSDWFEDRIGLCTTEDSRWQVAKDFLLTEFRVLGKKLLGQDLVRAYRRLPKDFTVRARESREFLNQLFNYRLDGNQ